MFGFFKFGFIKTSRRKATARRTVKLGFDRLEARETPTVGLTMSVTPLSGQAVLLSGQVTDANPATSTVSFSGVMSGTATPDSNGYYSYQANASALGEVDAIAHDAQNVASSTVPGQVTSSAPSIQLSVSYGQNHDVMLSGTVTDHTPGGLTVSFTGVATGSVVTNSDGTFSLTLQASSLGDVQARTSNIWGQSSSPAQVSLINDPPYIVTFTASLRSGTVWVLSGQVSDEHPEGLTVRFTGLVSTTTLVASDGSFGLALSLPYQNGTITANLVDWWGSTSNEVTAMVCY